MPLTFSGPALRGYTIDRRGPWILCLQKLLNRWGMDPPVAEDGVYGPDTHAATMGAMDYFGMPSHSVDDLDAVQGYQLESLAQSMLVEIGESAGVYPCADQSYYSQSDYTAPRKTTRTPAAVASKPRGASSLPDPQAQASKAAVKHISLGLGPVDGMINLAIDNWPWTLSALGVFVYSKYVK